MGEFTCLAHAAPKYLFLSGGSGITPLMSMARTYHDLSLPADIVFVHNARTPADIIFRAELELMARNLPGFRFVPVCETDATDERWTGFSGRISPAMLQLMAPDLLEREVFTCGPAPYMAAVRRGLGELGYDMARYHEESFDFAALSAEEIVPALKAEAELAAEPVAVNYKVEFAKSQKTIECGADSFVLNAARGAGLRLPSSCTKGLVRHLQEPARLRQGRDEAPGRHPPARDRPGDGAPLLLEAAHRSRRRSLNGVEATLMETEARQAERRTRSGGRSARRALRLAADLSMLPALHRNLPLCEVMDTSQVERIDAASMAILEEVGVVFRDPVALADWRRAGATCAASASTSTAASCASSSPRYRRRSPTARETPTAACRSAGPTRSSCR